MDKERIDKFLSKSIFNKKIHIFESLDSTNTEAINGNYDHFSVILAQKQTSGKGRSGRKWFSDTGNLYFSIILSRLPIEKLLPLNIIIGYAICDAIRHYAEVKLKWPNDIVYNGKKIGGILIETKFSGNTLEKIVVGIGINVNQKEFDNEISYLATSLSIITGQNINLEDILTRILVNIEKYYKNLLKNRIDIIEKWCKYSNNFGRNIKIHINGVKVEFIEKGITENGELIVEDKYGKEQKIVLGDIDL